MNTLSNLPGLPTMTYAGLDGQGRIRTVTAGSGSITGLVTATTYNNTDPVTANEPLGALTSVSYGVNGGATDSDTFHYDKNSGRMLQWQFSVNGQLQVGALGWNSNGSLASLNITDAFNANNAQNCSFSHDDLSRLAGVNCGTGKWNQTFAYDPYGNINKTGSGIGTSFQATYNTASNRISALPGFTPTYDAAGNLLNDSFHQYQWDGDGKPTQIDSVGVTYDALGRMVEQNRSGAYTQIVYGPGGNKLALMNGQALVKAFVPLPGGATAVYNSSGLQYYRHSDWLGSSRLASKPNRTVHFSGAYAPFGEDYAKTGTTDLNFTGQNQDTVQGDYDFMLREYSPVQGRWISPDPVGLLAVDLTDPQTWNMYVYVGNSPLIYVDPLGLRPCLQFDGTVADCPDKQPGAPEPSEPNINDARSPGSGAGCSVGMGLFSLNFAACPFGGGGNRSIRERVTERIRQILQQAANAVACGVLSGPVQSAKGIQQVTGGVVQVGGGGTAAGGLPGRAAVAGQAALTVAADGSGRSALVLTLGGGRATGGGALAGPLVAVSPFATGFTQLKGTSGLAGVARGAGGFAGEFQASATARGTFSVMAGRGAGAFVIGGGGSNSFILTTFKCK